MKILSYLKTEDEKDIDGTQYYRQVSPLNAVNDYAEGIDVTFMTKKSIEDVQKEHGAGLVGRMMSGYDIYAYPRMIHEDCEAFLEEVHKQGGLLVVDSDDDLTEDYKLVSGRGQAFKKMLGLVDYVTVSTPALADRFAPLTKRPPVALLNCVDVDWMQSVSEQSKRIVEGLTIGFSGSPTHWGDWYLPAVPLQRICREFPVRAILHGETPRYLNYCQDGVIKIGGVPYIVYPVILAQFDILLCAVDIKDPFNAGKSAVKALECMATGVVPICSRFKPYMDLADQGAPLVIVEEESRDGWYGAMADLLCDSDRIDHHKSQGPDWVRAHRDIKTGYKQWESFFRAITD